MFAHFRHAAIIVLGLAGSTLAGDNVRLIGKPSDREDVRRLDIKPGDQAQDDTERTHYRYGVRFYGGYGYYGGFRYYGGLGYYGYRPYSYFGYRPYSSFGYWPYSYAYSWPSYAYSAPYYYGYPFYSYSYYWPSLYYSAPPVYYSSPVVIYSSIAAAPADNGELRNGTTTTFRYDGDRANAPPIERIPPAKIESPAVPELPTPPAVPKLGPSPTERMVSVPAPTVKKKYTYPAYGEDRERPRDDKTLLIRRDK